MSDDQDAQAFESPLVGSAPRAWSSLSPETLAIEIPLMLQGAEAEHAVIHLMRRDGVLSPTEIAALGRLNFLAYLKSIQPPVALLVDRTSLDPTFAEFVRFALRD